MQRSSNQPAAGRRGQVDDGAPDFQELSGGTLLTAGLSLSSMLPPGAQLVPIQGPVLYSGLQGRSLLAIPSIAPAAPYQSRSEGLLTDRSLFETRPPSFWGAPSLSRPNPLRPHAQHTNFTAVTSNHVHHQDQHADFTVTGTSHAHHRSSPQPNRVNDHKHSSQDIRVHSTPPAGGYKVEKLPADNPPALISASSLFQQPKKRHYASTSSHSHTGHFRLDTIPKARLSPPLESTTNPALSRVECTSSSTLNGQVRSKVQDVPPLCRRPKPVLSSSSPPTSSSRMHNLGGVQQVPQSSQCSSRSSPSMIFSAQSSVQPQTVSRSTAGGVRSPNEALLTPAAKTNTGGVRSPSEALLTPAAKTSTRASAVSGSVIAKSACSYLDSSSHRLAQPLVTQRYSLSDDCRPTGGTQSAPSTHRLTVVPVGQYSTLLASQETTSSKADVSVSRREVNNVSCSVEKSSSVPSLGYSRENFLQRASQLPLYPGHSSQASGGKPLIGINLPALFAACDSSKPSAESAKQEPPAKNLKRKTTEQKGGQLPKKLWRHNLCPQPSCNSTGNLNPAFAHHRSISSCPLAMEEQRHQGASILSERRQQLNRLGHSAPLQGLTSLLGTTSASPILVSDDDPKSKREIDNGLPDSQSSLVTTSPSYSSPSSVSEVADATCEKDQGSVCEEKASKGEDEEDDDNDDGGGDPKKEGVDVLSGSCPYPGCSGLGHVKGGKFGTHRSLSGCPMAKAWAGVQDSDVEAAFESLKSLQSLRKDLEEEARTVSLLQPYCNALRNEVEGLRNTNRDLKVLGRRSDGRLQHRVSTLLACLLRVQWPDGFNVESANSAKELRAVTERVRKLVEDDPDLFERVQSQVRSLHIPVEIARKKS